MLSRKMLIILISVFLVMFLLLNHFGSAAISDWFARAIVVVAAILFVAYRLGKHRTGYEQLLAAGAKVDGKPSLWASCYLATPQNGEVRYMIGSYTSIQRAIRNLPAGTPHQWGHLDAAWLYRTPQDLSTNP